MNILTKHTAQMKTGSLVRKVLFVVYTDRGDATRIISARKATEAETEVYYDNYTQDDL